MTSHIVTFPMKPGPTRHIHINDITEMPRPRYRSHWALLTSDMAASEAFYATLTGAARIVEPTFCTSTYSWDEEHHRFFFGHRDSMAAMYMGDEAARAPSPPAGTHAAVAGGGIRFSSAAALLAAVGRMEEAGYMPERIEDRGALVSVLYRDPEGLIVDIFAQVPGTAERPGELLDLGQLRARFG
jgi:catechol 2,3-dioxygenase-like lactoylglutathione lyase family enzyme